MPKVRKKSGKGKGFKEISEFKEIMDYKEISDCFAIFAKFTNLTNLTNLITTTFGSATTQFVVRRG